MHDRYMRARTTSVPFAGPAWLDLPLLFSVFCLSVIGLIMVSSASVEYAQARYDHWWWLAWRHLQHLTVAALCACLAFLVPLRWWYATIPLLLVASLLVLSLVLVPGLGAEAGGARRWLVAGGVAMQPSELAKWLAVIYLARFLADVHTHAGHLSLLHQARPLALIALLCLLLLAEPDMGSVLLILCTVGCMLFLGGARLRDCAALCAAFGVLCVALIALSPYRWNRVMTFMNPWQDITGDGYQLFHALNAISAGGVWGAGLGHGLEKQFYLPAAHTDFIFAVMAEELGLVGLVGVVGLFCVVVARIWRTARMAQSCGRFFVMYVLYGTCLLLAFQSFINMGVNLALLPTKGMTLPFISYGGSSLVVSFLMVAWVLRAHRELLVEQGLPRPERY